MKTLQKILFPTDFGPSSSKDLENAVAVANKFGSELIILHVLPDYPAWSSFIPKIEKKVQESMNEVNTALSNQSGLNFTTRIETGNYSDKIVEIARNEKVNLILLGAGTPKNEKHKLGSTSEKIIRNTTIPVWVMKNNWSFSMETILCPVDFSEASTLALENAIHLARKFNSKLIVLHVGEALDDEYSKFDVDLESEQDAFEQEEDSNFDNYLSKFNFTELDWQKKLRIGKPDEIIQDIIHDNVVDLLIMGSSGRTGLRKFFLGSVTEKVIQSVPCSFITTTSQDFIKLELEQGIVDQEKSYEEAVKLANEGFLDEALAELNNCLQLNEYNVKAWRGKAEIYERLGDKEKSVQCEEMAAKIQRSIWDKQIEADLRRQNSMFK